MPLLIQFFKKLEENSIFPLKGLFSYCGTCEFVQHLPRIYHDQVNHYIYSTIKMMASRYHSSEGKTINPLTRIFYTQILHFRNLHLDFFSLKIALYYLVACQFSINNKLRTYFYILNMNNYFKGCNNKPLYTCCLIVSRQTADKAVKDMDSSTDSHPSN